MAVYRIFRMKENERQRFRWAPHTSGTTLVKPKDFEENGSVEASSFYDAWTLSKAMDAPIDIGDILVANEEMRILKYIGFEEAKWVVPEPKQAELVGVVPEVQAPAMEAAQA